MPPHHTLREPGGAAGVQQIDVVRAAFTEITLGRGLFEGRIELDAAVALVIPIFWVTAVLHHQHGLHVRCLGQHVGDAVGVAPLVHQGHHVGVLEQVLQLALDIAEVDVDQNGARLDDAEHRDNDLDAVAAVEPDLVVLLDALVDEVVGELVGLLLQLAVGQLVVTADQGDTIWHGVDGVFGKVCNVQGHGTKLERVTFRDKSVASMQEGGLFRERR